MPAEYILKKNKQKKNNTYFKMSSADIVTAHARVNFSLLLLLLLLLFQIFYSCW